MKNPIWQRLAQSALLLTVLLSFGCSSFVLTSTPTAEVYENNTKVGQTPYSFSIVSGRRSLTLKRFGYVEQPIEVTALDPKQLHFDLQWVGRTHVETQPPGATVYSKDSMKKLGTTPCGLTLSRGESVVIKKEGYETVERELDPNMRYMVKLKSTAGYKSVSYKDIQFTSSQGSVHIYDRIAGERIGITPVRLYLETGSALEYRLAGFKSRYDLVSRNAPMRVNIELEPLTRVTFTGPPGASIYRAGGIEKIGDVPVTLEVTGDTLCEVKKDGFYDRTVALAPGSPSRMSVELEKIPYKTIVTEPTGAEVYRLGGIEKLGLTPYTAVVKEERVFEIKKEGYRTSLIGMGPTSAENFNVPLLQTADPGPDAAAIGELDSLVIESF
ncbi:MAG: PEGA domain-containing protein [Kiritimatiellales bacterium]|nr:PEGA domain-containing protein [Kiritimatiellales bacterium]